MRWMVMSPSAICVLIGSSPSCTLGCGPVSGLPINSIAGTGAAKRAFGATDTGSETAHKPKLRRRYSGWKVPGYPTDIVVLRLADTAGARGSKIIVPRPDDLHHPSQVRHLSPAGSLPHEVQRTHGRRKQDEEGAYIGKGRACPVGDSPTRQKSARAKRVSSLKLRARLGIPRHCAERLYAVC